MRKLTQNSKKRSNVNIAETDPKYSEISQHFSAFNGFPIILEIKRRKRALKLTFNGLCLISIKLKLKHDGAQLNHIFNFKYSCYSWAILQRPPVHPE